MARNTPPAPAPHGALTELLGTADPALQAEHVRSLIQQLQNAAVPNDVIIISGNRLTGQVTVGSLNAHLDTTTKLALINQGTATVLREQVEAAQAAQAAQAESVPA